MMMSTKMRLKFKFAIALFEWCRLMERFYTKIGLENMATRWFIRANRIFCKFMIEYLYTYYTRK